MKHITTNKKYWLAIPINMFSGTLWSCIMLLHDTKYSTVINRLREESDCFFLLEIMYLFIFILSFIVITVYSLIPAYHKKVQFPSILFLTWFGLHTIRSSWIHHGDPWIWNSDWCCFCGLLIYIAIMSITKLDHKLNNLLKILFQKLFNKKA